MNVTMTAEQIKVLREQLASLSTMANRLSAITMSIQVEIEDLERRLSIATHPAGKKRYFPPNLKNSEEPDLEADGHL